MIGERVYHKPKQWNVYQPDTFKLDKLLRGIGRFAVELNVKVHIKGFTFTRHSRAWDTLAAGACDAVYPRRVACAGHRQQCLAAV